MKGLLGVEVPWACLNAIPVSNAHMRSLGHHCRCCVNRMTSEYREPDLVILDIRTGCILD